MATASSDRIALLNQLAQDFVERLRRGERPSLEEYVDRHPELAGDIRELLPNLVDMEQAKANCPQVPAAVGGLTALERLGDYRILREIGHGGMGVVYEAEQVSLGRHVALKVLPKQLLVDPRTKRRFEREARAAAKLHHTNIVPVFGVGEHDGLPYYAMQFIQGTGLDTVIAELARMTPDVQSPADPGSAAKTQRDVSAVAHSLLTGAYHAVNDPSPALTCAMTETPPDRGDTPTGPVASRSDSSLANASGNLPGQSGASSGSLRRLTFWQRVARVGEQVAGALAYAHKQGIVHRDIKPSNLLLDMTGTVWVTDFGLAKADDQQQLTHTGDILGTLRYIPPEAFEGQSDGRGDVYSLGLTLYELAALRPAFVDSDRNRLIKRVTSGEPEALGRVRKGVPRDLETIIHKAIERDPARRYQKAEELADDLRRFLDDQPVKARRASAAERLNRWARRNRGVALALGVIALLLIGVAIASSMAAWRFERLADERERARSAAETAAAEAVQRGNAERWQRYRANLSAAAAALQIPNTGAARRALAAAPVEYRSWEWLHFNSRLDDARLVLPMPRGPKSGIGQIFQPALAFIADDKRIVAGSPDGTFRVWDTADGSEVGVLPGKGSCTLQALVGPDGRLLVLTGDGMVQSWNQSRKDATLLLQMPEEGLRGQLLSRDGRLALGTTKDYVGQLWDLLTGRKRATLPGRIAPGVNTAAFSADGRYLAYSTDDFVVHLWDVQTSTEACAFRGHSAHVRALAFSPDGKRLASGANYPDNSVHLWSVPAHEETAVLRGHRNEVTWVAFSPDGSRLASASLDHTARLWDVAAGKLRASIKGHNGILRKAAFSPDGRRLVTASEDETLRLWDSADGELVAVLRGHTGPVWGATFSADGARLASWSESDDTVRLWDLGQVERGGVLRGHTSYVYDVAFSRDGTQVVSAAWDGTARIWDPATGRETHRFQHLTQLPDGIITGACFNSDGSQVASVAATGAVVVWNVATGNKARTLAVPPGDWRGYPRVAFERTGKLLAAGGGDGAVRLWNAAGDTAIAVLHGHEGPVSDVAFSPDGTQLVSAGVDGAVYLWDIQTGSKLASLHDPGPAMVYGVAYSLDGRLVACAAFDKAVRLWDTATHDMVAVLPHDGIVYGVAFSPDGRRLAAGCADNSIRLWEVATAAHGGGKEVPEAEVAELRGHNDYVHAVAWSPDGTRLISASGDHTLRVWDSLAAHERAKREGR
jgi:WD40 repeat protein/serine/threonine protein kinase